ncbi:MAG: DUF1800 family protein [Ignavibacteria bacterium]
MKRREFFSLKTKHEEDFSGLSQDAHISHMKRVSAGLEPFIPSDSQPWDYERAAHLLRRTMIGPTDKEIRQALTLGIDQTIAMLCTPHPIDSKEIEPWCKSEPQIRAIPANSDIPGLKDQDFQTQTIIRRELITRWYIKTLAISPISVQEKMTMFWSGILTTEIDVVNFSEWMFNQQVLLRKHCLGNFKTLINDITIDPAMLIYLDGRLNQKTSNTNQINENYARELMELFTCGPTDWNNAPNYTEDDVREAARALSGWTIAGSTNPNATARPYYAGLKSNFIPSRWDSGTKTFMDVTGNWKASDIINILFEKRSLQISRYICERLYKAFVYDIPDRTIIDEMAAIFRKDWEIKPVLETLLRSAHFFDSENIGAMYKSPASFLIGSIRSMNISKVPDFRMDVSSVTNRDLSNRMISMGEILFNPPNVKGWPGGRSWVSTSTVSLRHKFMLDVIDGKIMIRDNGALTQFYVFDSLAFARTFPEPNDPEALCMDLVLFMLNRKPTEKEYSAYLEALLMGAKIYEWNIDDPAFKPVERIKNLLRMLVVQPMHQLH